MVENLSMMWHSVNHFTVFHHLWAFIPNKPTCLPMVRVFAAGFLLATRRSWRVNTTPSAMLYEDKLGSSHGILSIINHLCCSILSLVQNMSNKKSARQVRKVTAIVVVCCKGPASFHSSGISLKPRNIRTWQPSLLWTHQLTQLWVSTWHQCKP